MEELDFEDEVSSIGHDENNKKEESDKNSVPNEKIVSDSDSDSGEIEDDEVNEPTDLEEGEIKESTQNINKKSEVVCRFFKRGTCLFGSQCSFLHVSDKVYNMFDNVPHRKRNMKYIEPPLPPPPPNFYKPINFPPNFLPPRLESENTNLIMPKTNLHRQEEEPENTWEKGLEQAKILIQNANLKKKGENSEINKLVSDKDRRHPVSKTDSETFFDTYGKKSPKKDYYSMRREVSEDEKETFKCRQKSNYDWVDPWRRSKSPLSKKRRTSSISLSPLPHSRKRSYASSSSTSSSSDFENIYEKPYQKKSPKIARRSRSISSSRHPKIRKVTQKESFYRRDYSRSDTRTVTYCPKNRPFRSRSRSSTSLSSYSGDDNTPDKSVSNGRPQMCKSPLQKASKTPPTCYSDGEASEMTVSSASCTPISSCSESDNSDHSPSSRNKLSPNKASFHHKRSSYQASPEEFERNKDKSKVMLTTYNTKDSSLESVNTMKSAKSKPTSNTSKKEFSEMEYQLLRYQGSGYTNNKGEESSAKTTIKVGAHSLSSEKVPGSTNGSKRKISLNSKPKSQFSPDNRDRLYDSREIAVNASKETASKRVHLLEKLKLIEDAIARKRQA
ncbi:c3H1-type domain-containing protein [Caerostris extrusa]|uniref:C3H1-type domain-containing protein n=1 Tax=Caerostris extrusa TaxID=172846 RepID=A0AAV4UBL8_CAEEX|nr:c3H1-type domain-containing protein [Caerostris extrusa]